MSDALSAGPKSPSLNHLPPVADESTHSHHVDPAKPKHDAPEAPNGAVDQIVKPQDEVQSSEDVLGNGRSDSEAETVVLSGKEDQQRATKEIKVEEAESGSEAAVSHAQRTKSNRTNRTPSDGSCKPSLKRKRGKDEPNAADTLNDRESSNLSSTTSSPVLQAHSSKASDSKSDRSRSSPPLEEISHQHSLQLKKPRNEEHFALTHCPQSKNDGSSPEKLHGHERRETRSATHFDESTRQSTSPLPREGDRARSTQSHLPPPNGVKKRRKPAPLHVDRRRKPSEEIHAESDDSSSVQSHPRLHKLATNDTSAMSPAKVSHKKNRDRNGRTQLARSVTQGITEARHWIKERPQDLNVGDNAGNTPLQIASLEGEVEIVQLLLDAGCDISCKNIDSDTPLIDAVENGHLDVVRALLKAGLDPRQSNAVGKEPIDLVNPEHDDCEDIRAALRDSKREAESTRRQSEDHYRPHAKDLRDTDVTSASGPSPTNSARSPPPLTGLDAASRRRTARSQPTNDSLLWVSHTPQALREAAGKGDASRVGLILGTTPKADTETILAAARGGHDVVLELLLAMTQHEEDPLPLRSGDYKPGYNTPMLAAIGRGNIKVIKLLLNRRGFDPTRRLFGGLTYYEIAKERQGSEWQQEHDTLKEAYDSYKGPKSNHNSPRKARKQRAGSRISSPERPSSPHEVRKQRRPLGSFQEDSDADTRRKPSYQGTAAKRREGHESSAVASDRESELLGPPKSKPRERRSTSDAAPLVPTRPDAVKPKRKLMSGNDFKNDQELRRKASVAAEPASTVASRRRSNDSVSSHDRPQLKSSPVSISPTSPLEGMLEGKTKGNYSPNKKRSRHSASPEADPALPNGALKKKRQKVDAQANSAEKDLDQSSDVIEPESGPGLATVANMITSPTSVTSTSHGAAPIAFMGSSATSLPTRPFAEIGPQSTAISPINDDGLNIHHEQAKKESHLQDDFEKDKIRKQLLDQEHEHEREIARIEKEKLAILEVERQENLQAQHAKDALAKREESDRQARALHEAKEARLEVQREADEAERQLQLERIAEEARIAKRKRDEELHKRRLEQERLRKEEQQQRRREQEERENLRRLKLQQDEEHQRRSALPKGLRRAAELGADAARQPKEISKWLPLKTVTTRDLDPGCEAQTAHEKWLSNVQVAPILANADLGLPQCKGRIYVLRR